MIGLSNVYFNMWRVHMERLNLQYLSSIKLAAQCRSFRPIREIGLVAIMHCAMAALYLRSFHIFKGHCMYTKPVRNHLGTSTLLFFL